VTSPFAGVPSRHSIFTLRTTCPALLMCVPSLSRSGRMMVWDGCASRRRSSAPQRTAGPSRRYAAAGRNGADPNRANAARDEHCGERDRQEDVRRDHDPAPCLSRRTGAASARAGRPAALRRSPCGKVGRAFSVSAASTAAAGQHLATAEPKDSICARRPTEQRFRRLTHESIDFVAVNRCAGLQ
jgi:hypothetical protein